MSQPTPAGHRPSSPPPREQVLLVAMQNPEYDLLNLSKVFGNRGLSPLDQHPSGDPENPRWTFRTLDGKSQILLQMFGELGVYRLTLQGPEALALLQAIPSMMPILAPNLLAQRIQMARTPEERQMILALLVLSFASADVAMSQLGPLLQQGDPDLLSGLIMGLRLMESAEAAEHLSYISKALPPGSPIADAAADAYNHLVALGVAKPKLDPETVLAQVEPLIEINPPGALEKLDALAETGFSSPRAALLRARALVALDRWDESAPFVSQALQDPACRPTALFLQARLAERHGDLAAARASVRESLKLAPTDEAARAFDARLTLQLDASHQSPEQQRQHLDAAISQNPDDPELRLQRAALLLQLGLPADALRDVQAARAHAKPDDARLDLYEVEAHLRRGAYLSALQKHITNLALLPPSLRRQAALQRGRIYLALDDAERAARAFAETLNRDAYPEAALGQALAIELQNPAFAQKLYARALDASPPAALLASLQPILYAARPLCPIHGLPLSARPASRIGADIIDPMFKYCLDCGTAALNRRTSCKNCGSKTFLSAG